MAKVEIFNGDWSRAQVAADKNRVYLFGDNLQDMVSGYVPTVTQAVIRGLPNAIGVPTKVKRGYDDSSYFWDNEEDFELFCHVVDEAIKRAKSTGKTIVIPSGGIGTGRAAVRGAFSVKGNRFKAYLDQALASLGTTYGTIRIVNLRDNYIPHHGSNEVLIRIDRKTPLGNPFFMKVESQRDHVCDMYEQYFRQKVSAGDDDEFIAALEEILAVVRSGKNVALACWCAPKRCHGETIKAYIEHCLTLPWNNYEQMEIPMNPEADRVKAIMDQIRETGEWVIQSSPAQAIGYNNGHYVYRSIIGGIVNHGLRPGIVTEEQVIKFIQEYLK